MQDNEINIAICVGFVSGMTARRRFGILYAYFFIG